MLKTKLVIIAFITILISPVVFASNPSFDCTRASTQIEKAICAYDELGEIDKRMSVKFNETKNSLEGQDKKRFIRGQINWNSARGLVCRYPNRYKTCLHDLYEKRIQYFTLLMSKGETGLIEQYTTYRMDDYPPVWENGNLIFSGYDETGNSFDVKALNPLTGQETTIIHSRRGAQYLTENKKYLVFRQKGSVAHPLILKDKKSGKEIKRIKLKNPILWARIYNNQLVLVQNKRFSRSASSEVTFFSLPHLKVIRKSHVIGGHSIKEWNNQIISIGNNIGIYDKSFNEIRVSERIPRKHPTRNVICANGQLNILKNKLIAETTCGAIRIYQLPNLTLERTIPSYSTHSAITVNNGLIFSSSVFQGGQHGDTRVFDLNTGKQLAVLPVKGDYLFSIDNKLISVIRRFSKTSDISVYQYDVSQLKSSDIRFIKIRDAFKSAENVMKGTGDVYLALQICDKASLSSMIEEPAIPDEMIPVLYRYAVWLSQTYDNFSRAKPIFDYLKNKMDAEKLLPHIETVTLKEYIIKEEGYADLNNLTNNPATFAKKVQLGSKDAVKKSIDFGAFTGLIKFHKDKIYIGRWGRRSGHRHFDAPSSLLVLDRKKYNVIKEIDIVPYDPEQQDNISNIAFDENNIYLSIAYRFDDPGRTNFVVVDNKTLTIQSTEKPQFFNDSLFCDTFYDDIKKDLNNYVCPAMLSNYGALIEIKRPGLRGLSIDAVSKNYFVTKKRIGSETGYKKVHRTKEIPGTEIHISGKPDIYAIPESDTLILRHYIDGVVSYSLYDMPTDKGKTLIRLKAVNNKYPGIALTSMYAFLSYGRDLIILNLKNNTIEKYISGFISEGYKDNGHGVDVNKISRITIDGDKLIVLTFSGVNNRVVDWKKLLN